MADNEYIDNDENDVTDTYNYPDKEEPIRDSRDTNSSSKLDNKRERKLHNRRCPYCKQEYETKIGIDNWKNLFRKPTMDDWIVLIILILIIGAAFAYTTETKTCRETLNNLDQICMKRGTNITYNGNGVPVYALPQNLTVITNDTTIENNTVAQTNVSVNLTNTTDIATTNKTNVTNIVVNKTINGTINLDIDKYGCNNTAGYIWCTNKQKCIKPLEENCTSQ